MPPCGRYICIFSSLKVVARLEIYAKSCFSFTFNACCIFFSLYLRDTFVAHRYINSLANLGVISMSQTNHKVDMLTDLVFVSDRYFWNSKDTFVDVDKYMSITISVKYIGCSFYL